MHLVGSFFQSHLLLNGHFFEHWANLAGLCTKERGYSQMRVTFYGNFPPNPHETATTLRGSAYLAMVSTFNGKTLDFYWLYNTGT